MCERLIKYPAKKERLLTVRLISLPTKSCLLTKLLPIVASNNIISIT